MCFVLEIHCLHCLSEQTLQKPVAWNYQFFSLNLKSFNNFNLNLSTHSCNVTKVPLPRYLCSSSQDIPKWNYCVFQLVGHSPTSFFGVSNIFPVKFPSSVPTYSCLLFSHWSLSSGSNVSTSLLFRLSPPFPCVAHLSSIPAPTATHSVAISAPDFWPKTRFRRCSRGLLETQLTVLLHTPTWRRL